AENRDSEPTSLGSVVLDRAASGEHGVSKLERSHDTAALSKHTDDVVPHLVEVVASVPALARPLQRPGHGASRHGTSTGNLTSRRQRRKAFLQIVDSEQNCEHPILGTVVDARCLARELLVEAVDAGAPCKGAFASPARDEIRAQSGEMLGLVAD